MQELLGYDIFEPFIGYVDGVHPERLLSPRVRGARQSGAEEHQPETTALRMSSR